jgi:hypothetical protein
MRLRRAPERGEGRGALGDGDGRRCGGGNRGHAVMESVVCRPVEQPQGAPPGLRAVLRSGRRLHQEQRSKATARWPSASKAQSGLSRGERRSGRHQPMLPRHQEAALVWSCSSKSVFPHREPAKAVVLSRAAR